MGAKHELFDQAPDPINIITCIEKADRFFENKHQGSQKRMISDCYAWLSEFAHPNFNSNDSAIRLINDGIAFRHGEDISEDELKLLGYLSISAGLFVAFFDQLGTFASAVFDG
jgi:hypothetical protein